MSVPTDKMDLEERLSSLQSPKKGGYANSKTPKELEDGALVEGGALDLKSREAFGLFSQYAAIGIIYNMLTSISYSLFTIYLGMEGYQTTSYFTLVTLGWSFKVVGGMISDCVPIFGYRRKSWMIIGWTIAMICLAIMTFSPFGAPYCDRRRTNLCRTPLQNISAADKADYFNLSAPHRGGFFIIVSMFTSFGSVIAACASDAMVVQYAQREPLAIRGRVQTAIYTVRVLMGSLSQIVVAFLLNGKVYAGSFDFAIGPNAIYAICLVPCVIVILITIFVVVEEKTPRTPFGQWVSEFWTLLQKRVMWQICAFRFISAFFLSIRVTATEPMGQIWARVEPLNYGLSQLGGSFLFGGILVVVGKWGLGWNWRWTIALGTMAIVAIDAVVVFVTIWDVVRNQWFYTGVTMAENIPDGIRFMVSTFCAVEIADVGNEGATYGLVTTVSNLAFPVASVVFKFINSFFLVSQNDLKTDSTIVRWHVTYCYLISYTCKLASLIWLFMLPPQKAELQALKKRGGTSKVAGALVVGSFVAAISFALTSNLMAINPATSCYRIAGGKGTVNGTCRAK